MPSAWPADDMAAELVADLERAFEVEPRARLASGRRWSRAASRPRHRPQTRCGHPPRRSPTTVRQTPEQAIEAPIAIEARVIGAGDPEPAQPFARRLAPPITSPTSVVMPVNILCPLEHFSAYRADRLGGERLETPASAPSSGMPFSASMPSAPIALGRRGTAPPRRPDRPDERGRDASARPPPSAA